MNNNIQIVYEDKDFLVLNKPAGVLTHEIGARSKERIAKREPTLADWLVSRYPEIKNVGDDPVNRPGIVHRLDKGTSGVILAARNQKAFEYFKNLFSAGGGSSFGGQPQIKKTYLALVYGRVQLKIGIIEKPIGLKPGTIRRSVHIERLKLVKPAITEYFVKKYLKLDSQEFTLVEAMPKTGRTHQIRVHLASIGHPVVGDSVYGPKTNPFGLERQFLHAESLEFTAPSGSRLKISADLPEDLTKIIS